MAAVIAHNPITTLESSAAMQTAGTAVSKTSAEEEAAPNASSAAISANDFLTLLVTEMKNQDPTATTDPNEYINQLVNVNSLEQLIDINQTLTSAYGSSSAYTTSNAAAQMVSPQGATRENQVAVLGSAHLVNQIPASAASTNANAAVTLPGNLGVPARSPAAERLGEALGGNSRMISTLGISAVR